jgi:thioredoxin reductase (NADPH)
MTDTHDTVILGSGCAGLTAAIYTARAGLNPLVLEGHEPGGQLSITTLVENFPGWPDGIQGPELIENMKKQAARFGATYQLAHLDRVDLNVHPFRLFTSGGEICTRTLIVASGASARWLGLPSEQALIGHGVSSCATCDGFFFRGKEVVVVGGGNTAVEEALYLTNHATRVTLVHRRNTLRAEKILQARLFAHPKVQVVWDSVIAEVLSGGAPAPHVIGVRLTDVNTGAERELACDGLFIAIGHNPVTQIFQGQLELDAEGYIITRPDSTATAIPGVFAAGDVRDKIFRQAVTAAGMGCMAALEAEKFLAAAEAEAALKAAE